MSTSEILELLNDINRKVDSIQEELSSAKPSKGGKKTTPASKVENFKLSTTELLSSKQKLCSYMQKNDCDGHCGKEAKYSVINGNPVELTDIQQAPAKDAKKEKLRRGFYRCNTCKNKGKSQDTSRGYKKVYDHLYDNGGDDEVFDEDVAGMISPKASSAKKSSDDSDSEDEAPNVEKGLDKIEEESGPNPADNNKHLKKTNKFHDKFISVKVGKSNVNCIIRSFEDKRKTDVCIGEISEEPGDSDYEEELKKPKPTLLEKIGLKYKSPEDSVKETPPKASKVEGKKGKKKEEGKKKPQVKKDDSDSDSDSGEENSKKGAKALKKMSNEDDKNNTDSDSD